MTAMANLIQPQNYSIASCSKNYTVSPNKQSQRIFNRSLVGTDKIYIKFEGLDTTAVAFPTKAV